MCGGKADVAALAWLEGAGWTCWQEVQDAKQTNQEQGP